MCFLFIPAGKHWSIWFWHSATCIRITTSGIIVFYVFVIFCIWLDRRILGNVNVSFSGDVATRYLSFETSYRECCQMVWQTVLPLLFELRVQVSPFPLFILVISLRYFLVVLWFSPLQCAIRMSGISFYYMTSIWRHYPHNSAVHAHLFFEEEDWASFKQIVDNYMFEASQVYFHFRFKCFTHLLIIFWCYWAYSNSWVKFLKLAPWYNIDIRFNNSL